MNTINTRLVLAAISLAFAGAAAADPIVLLNGTNCGAGESSNGIAVTNVTGNNGGATDCWGTFGGGPAGNDPGPSGDGFDIGGTIFDFVAKEDTPGGLTGSDIGLDVSPNGGATSGTWAYDPTKFMPDSFLIVLKAANNPGYAVWLFSGDDANSFMGRWAVAWERDLSHLSIYASDDRPPPPPPPPTDVPAPGTLALLGLGLLAMGLTRRRRKV